MTQTEAAPNNAIQPTAKAAADFNRWASNRNGAYRSVIRTTISINLNAAALDE